MPFSDGDFISKEKHELDYVLRKWGKRTTQENRDILAAALDRFNADKALEPHTRELFYKYAEGSGLLSALEGKAGAEEAAPPAARAAAEAKAGAAGNPAAEGTSKPGPKFRWWWLLIVILLVLVAILLLRSCGGCSPQGGAAAQAPVSEPVASAAAPAAGAPAAAPAPAAAVAEKLLNLASLPKDSLVIRFVANSTDRLAAGEEAKLQALIAALKALDADKGELVLVGHAAGIGFPAGELLVSEGRARYIAKRLGEAGLSAGMTLTAEGRGAAAMLSGANAQAAAAASRRVEISVR